MTEVQLLDKTSADAMGAAAVRAKGYTGKGVTVAIVDSGCDATHPDLASRIAVIEKAYIPLDGFKPPEPIIGDERAMAGQPLMGDDDRAARSTPQPPTGLRILWSYRRAR